MPRPSAPGVPPAIDRLGLLASVACALHCVTTAVAPTALTLLGVSAVLEPGAEWVFTLVAVALAGLALALGLRRRGIGGVTLGLSLGVVGLLVARFLEELGEQQLGVIASVLSGGALVTGHLLNLRRARACGPCC